MYLPIINQEIFVAKTRSINTHTHLEFMKMLSNENPVLTTLITIFLEHGIREGYSEDAMDYTKICISGILNILETQLEINELNNAYSD